MKQKVKVHVQYYLTTGEWANKGDCRAHNAGELGISLDGSTNIDIDYRRWYGTNINVGEQEIEIEIPDAELLPIIKEQTQRAEGALREQLKALEAKFYMQKQALEQQIEQMLRLTNKQQETEDDVGNYIPANAVGDNHGDAGLASQADDAEDAEIIEAYAGKPADDADDGLPF